MFTKKSAVVAVMAVSAIGFLVSPVKAQTQVNQQNASQNAAAVGAFNSVSQGLTQVGIQDQATILGPVPQTQVNQQGAAQSAAAIGIGNSVTQTLEQISDQYQFNW